MKSKYTEVGEMFINLVREFPIGCPVYTTFGEVGIVHGYYRTCLNQTLLQEDEEAEFYIEVKIVGRFEPLDEQTVVRLKKTQIRK